MERVHRDAKHLRTRLAVISKSETYLFSNVDEGRAEYAPNVQMLTDAIASLQQAEVEIARAISRLADLANLQEPRPGDEFKLLFENLLELREAATEKLAPITRTTNQQTGAFRDYLKIAARIADPKVIDAKIEKAIVGATGYFRLLDENEKSFDGVGDDESFG